MVTTPNLAAPRDGYPTILVEELPHGRGCVAVDCGTMCWRSPDSHERFKEVPSDVKIHETNKEGGTFLTGQPASCPFLIPTIQFI